MSLSLKNLIKQDFLRIKKPVCCWGGCVTLSGGGMLIKYRRDILFSSLIHSTGLETLLTNVCPSTWRQDGKSTIASVWAHFHLPPCPLSMAASPLCISVTSSQKHDSYAVCLLLYASNWLLPGCVSQPLLNILQVGSSLGV